jgi:catechol 2,3-dioxygenase-like lactoylglutathione lyase family enzyme
MVGDVTIQRMDNVAIVVDDLDAAVAFFTELGMELEGKGQVEGLWADRTVGLDGVRSRQPSTRAPCRRHNVVERRINRLKQWHGMPPDRGQRGSRNPLADKGDSPGRRLANEEQSRSAVTAANTAAMAADNACDLWTTVEHRPSAQTVMDDPGRRACAVLLSDAAGLAGLPGTGRACTVRAVFPGVSVSRSRSACQGRLWRRTRSLRDP